MAARSSPQCAPPAAACCTCPAAGIAYPGFHLQHLSGVLDRLFTYAKEQPLNAHQLEALAGEGSCGPDSGLSALLQRFSRQVDLAIRQLEATPASELTQVRGVTEERATECRSDEGYGRSPARSCLPPSWDYYSMLQSIYSGILVNCL